AHERDWPAPTRKLDPSGAEVPPDGPAPAAAAGGAGTRARPIAGAGRAGAPPSSASGPSSSPRGGTNMGSCAGRIFVVWLPIEPDMAIRGWWGIIWLCTTQARNVTTPESTEPQGQDTKTLGPTGRAGPSVVS